MFILFEVKKTTLFMIMSSPTKRLLKLGSLDF